MVAIDAEIGAINLDCLREIFRQGNYGTMICGFIVFSGKDDDMIHILNNHWKMRFLNHIMGSTFPVFYVNPEERGERPFFLRDKLKMKVIAHVDMAYDFSDAPIFLEFQQVALEHTPSFVLFYWNENDGIESFSFEMEGYSEDSLFKSLCSIISIMKDAITFASKDQESTNSRSIFEDIIRSFRPMRIRRLFVRNRAVINLFEKLVRICR